MTSTPRAVSDPFKYLMEHHRAVSALFVELEDTTQRAVKTRQGLFQELNALLTLHAKLEEAALYPAVREKKETHTLTLEAAEEHQVVETLLVELAIGNVQSEVWMAKLVVLRENVDHHVKEEEKELFPKARKVLSKEEQDGVSDAMNAFLAAQ